MDSTNALFETTTRLH